MSNPQLHPLEVNPKTGEPFLRLRNHNNIILTPPRKDDVPAMVPFHNDPRVCEYLGGPPFPYTLGAELFEETTSSYLTHILFRRPCEAVLCNHQSSFRRPVEATRGCKGPARTYNCRKLPSESHTRGQ